MGEGIGLTVLIKKVDTVLVFMREECLHMFFPWEIKIYANYFLFFGLWFDPIFKGYYSKYRV